MKTDNKNITIRPFSTGNKEFHNLSETQQKELLSDLSQTTASTLDTYLDAMSYKKDIK